MRKPTDAQRDALTATDRIRVVQAAPGSGKTWLIAEAIRKELMKWIDRVGGVAMLSFTNVAGDEIRGALSRTPGHPHFVGTIDGFLYRFVVRPFAVWAFSGKVRQPHLIPADYVGFLDDRHWNSPLRVPTGRGSERVNLFQFDFCGKHQDGIPSFAYRAAGGPVNTDAALSAKVYQLKRDLWRRTGRMSHSDSAFLASQILGDQTHGEEIIGIVSRRFPLLVVDELQDTARHHMLALRTLLNHGGLTGLLVGDPDQSIYGFNGAHPEVFDVFERLEGAATLSLPDSLRCGSSICAVANHLSYSKRKIMPVASTGEGRAIMLVHDGNVNDLQSLANDIASRVHPNLGSITILVRKNAEVDVLNGEDADNRPAFHSPSLAALYRGAIQLRHGRKRTALALAEVALSRVLFSSPMPSEEDLATAGIQRTAWRQALGELLMAADERILNETAYEWGHRMQEKLVETPQSRGWWEKCPISKRPRGPASSTKAIRRTGHVSQTIPATNSVQVKTVHSAKGETHHTTIYFVAEAPTGRRCPSRSWWPTDDDDEEQRVAFVAATRAKRIFILCLPRKTFERLQATRPAFVSAFEVNDLQPDLCEVMSMR